MATITPTLTQTQPNSGIKKIFFYSSSATASDTFSVSTHFSSVYGAIAFRTPATGTVVTCTVSGTTITLGSGPSAEIVFGEVWGIG